MSAPKWIPSAPEIAREAVIVLAGAALAALLLYLAPPSYKQWLKDAWK